LAVFSIRNIYEINARLGTHHPTNQPNLSHREEVRYSEIEQRRLTNKTKEYPLREHRPFAKQLSRRSLQRKEYERRLATAREQNITENSAGKTITIYHLPSHPIHRP
jgi:hypothetical protein